MEGEQKIGNPGRMEATAAWRRDVENDCLAFLPHTPILRPFYHSQLLQHRSTMSTTPPNKKALLFLPEIEPYRLKYRDTVSLFPSLQRPSCS